MISHGSVYNPELQVGQFSSTADITPCLNFQHTGVNNSFNLECNHFLRNTLGLEGEAVAVSLDLSPFVGVRSMRGMGIIEIVDELTNTDAESVVIGDNSRLNYRAKDRRMGQRTGGEKTYAHRPEFSIKKTSDGLQISRDSVDEMWISKTIFPKPNVVRAFPYKQLPLSAEPSIGKGMMLNLPGVISALTNKVFTKINIAEIQSYKFVITFQRVNSEYILLPDGDRFVLYENTVEGLMPVASLPEDGFDHLLENFFAGLYIMNQDGYVNAHKK